MKKFVSYAIILAMLVSSVAVFCVPASAAMVSTDALGGYQNVCLTYTFDTSISTYGRHSVDDLMPYVAYLDKEGRIKDFFFDSYLFLPCVEFGPSGAPMHANDANPTKAQDWIAYVNDTFADGYNVDALDAAFGNVKAELNQPDKKAGVFFSILYPCMTATNFGYLGGKNLNLSNQADRKYAIKWMIDEQLRLYNEAGYDNLEVVGFYWLEEYLYNRGKNQYLENELFTYASQYLHSLGLKFIWIPWYQAYGYNFSQSLGIDVTCMQPNMLWQSNADYNRVADTCNTASQYGLCMEMEIAPSVFSDPEHYDRYLVYLEDGMNCGAMDSIKMYYQDRRPGVYYTAAHSANERKRNIYDLTYKYAKGTLTQIDIDNARNLSPVVLPENTEIVSFGKPYKASASYVGDGSFGYHSISGKELTDATFGSSPLGTEWHGFHYTLMESDSRMQIVLDLEEIRDDVNFFYAEFNNCGAAYSIGTPKNIQLHVSEDGVNYTLLAYPVLKNTSELYANISFECVPIKARYVKLSFQNEGGNFVFCSELLVGASTLDIQPDNDYAVPSDRVYLSGINKRISSGDCHLFTSDFGTVNTSTANHSWSTSVVAKWDSSRKAYKITDIFEGNGASTKSVTLSDDEIMIVSHSHEGSGVSMPVNGSLANRQKLKKAQIGDFLVLSNIDVENGKLDNNPLIKVVEYTEIYPDPNPIEGDANGDGKVNMFDYVYVKSVYFGTFKPNETEFAHCDINGDGKINMFDYVLLKSLVLTK